MTVCLIYVTTSNEEEALKIAGSLIEDQLVACANIIPGITSVFRWEGEIQKEREVSLILKTTEAHIPAVSDRVKLLHSYDCPCVVSWPLGGGNSAFLQWIESEVEVQPSA